MRRVMYFLLHALVALGLSMFLAKHVLGQFRLPIVATPCWLEDPWLPVVLNMLEEIPHWFPILRDLFNDVLAGLVLKGLPSLHLILWLFRDILLHIQGFSMLVCQAVAGWLKHLQQGFTSNVAKNEQVGIFERLYQTMQFLPQNYPFFWLN